MTKTRKEKMLKLRSRVHKLSSHGLHRGWRSLCCHGDGQFVRYSKSCLFHVFKYPNSKPFIRFFSYHQIQLAPLLSLGGITVYVMSAKPSP